MERKNDFENDQSAYAQLEKDAYLKFILDFVRPVDKMPLMGHLIDGVSEYDLLDMQSSVNEVDGHLQKRFVRLDKKYFADFIEMIKANPSSNYVTFLPEEDVLSGMVPNKLSVLMKKVNNVKVMFDGEPEKTKVYSEKVAPVFCDYFGVKTVCNQAFEDDGDFYVFSLDFIKPGQYFYNAAELGDDIKLNQAGSGDEIGLVRPKSSGAAQTVYFKDSLMNKNIEALKIKLDILKQKIRVYFWNEQPQIDKKKIEEDFVKMFLLRVFVFGDTDFCERNYGFVYDKTKHKIDSAPAFDFEFCFNCKAQNFVYKPERKLEFIFANYPKMVGEFMRKLKMLVDHGENETMSAAQNIIYASVADAVVANDMAYVFENNAAFLIGKYKEYAKGVAQEVCARG